MTKIVDKIELDPLYTKILSEGMADIVKRNEAMIAKGIIDRYGKLLDDKLPSDMKEGSRTEV